MKTTKYTLWTRERITEAWQCDGAFGTRGDAEYARYDARMFFGLLARIETGDTNPNHRRKS